MVKYHSELLMLFNLAFLMKCKYIILITKYNAMPITLNNWGVATSACSLKTHHQPIALLATKNIFEWLIYFWLGQSKIDRKRKDVILRYTYQPRRSALWWWEDTSFAWWTERRSRGRGGWGRLPWESAPGTPEPARRGTSLQKWSFTVPKIKSVSNVYPTWWM